MAEAPSRRWRRWGTVLVFALALYVIVRAADTPQDTQSQSRPRPAAPPPAASPAAAAAAARYDPADYAAQVRARARETGISAQLLMAILYNESYKPHDPELEWAWQRYKPGAAFGIANMHRSTFDDVKQGRDFVDRRWEDLPADRDLAIEAEAWYLHDLAAHWPAAYTRDELLALGYNAGPSNMLAFARGATPGRQARSYLQRLHDNWSEAGTSVARWH
ncbi:transglycosylase SLT domain-containing protein [Streptomyces vastus]